MKWMAHLQEMDYLKTGIGLRAIGQRDPLVEYKNEAYSAFQNMTSVMYDDFLRTLLRLQISIKIDAPKDDAEDRELSYSSPEDALSEGNTASKTVKSATQAGIDAAMPATPKPSESKASTFVKDKEDPFANVGRNDPCPCGSGKKYKKCHGA